MKGIFLFFPALLAVVFAGVMLVTFPPSAIPLGGIVAIIVLINHEEIISNMDVGWFCKMWMYISNSVIILNLATFIIWHVTKTDLGEFKVPIYIAHSLSTAAALFISLIASYIVWEEQKGE